MEEKELPCVCGKKTGSGIWGLREIRPQPCICTVFKDTGSRVQTVCEQGEIPPDTGAFISAHVLSLMNSAACNGTYRSCGGGASPLSFIHVCIWCEAGSLCRRGELFMAGKKILNVFRSNVIISINALFVLYQLQENFFVWHLRNGDTVEYNRFQLLQNKRHVCTQSLKC